MRGHNGQTLDSSRARKSDRGFLMSAIFLAFPTATAFGGPRGRFLFTFSILLVLVLRASSSRSWRVGTVIRFAVLFVFLPSLFGRCRSPWRAPCRGPRLTDVLEFAIFAIVAKAFLIEPTWSVVLERALLGITLVLKMRTAQRFCRWIPTVLL